MVRPPALTVLAVNCGSSSLKFRLAQVADTPDGRRPYEALASGAVEWTGDSATLRMEGSTVPVECGGHGAAVRVVLDRLTAARWPTADVVGHRIVHGGERYSTSVLLNREARTYVESASLLAPLHNGPALEAVRVAAAVLGDSVAQVGVFDTGFHRKMPDRAGLYAIDPALAERHGIRRYGFHGLAHQSMLEGYASMTKRDLRSLKVITLQLGNGCSIGAIDKGESVDTSMGLTPLEGLVMGTRSGDVDPTLAGFLASAEGMSLADAHAVLNNRSGLLGVSGRSRDMRELLGVEAGGDQRAALAVEMFCYRARKYIGSYMAALDGADAVVFGGGIGENQPEVRRRICEGLGWAGLRLDARRNTDLGEEGADGGRISEDGSLVECYVVRVDEEDVIVREAIKYLSRSQ